MAQSKVNTEAHRVCTPLIPIGSHLRKMENGILRYGFLSSIEIQISVFLKLQKSRDSEWMTGGLPVNICGSPRAGLEPQNSNFSARIKNFWV
jgi:hypothetical protein